MVLIGPIALLVWLLGTGPASAEPVSIALLTSIGVSAALAAPGTALVAFTTFALTTIASLAVSYVASALLKPTAKGGAAAQQAQSAPVRSNFNVRVAAGPRAILYGRRRVGGTYGLLRRTGRNQFLHMIILLVDHECEGFDQVIIADEVFNVSDLDGNGFIVGGRMGGLVRFRFHLGSPNQAADEVLVSELADGNRWNMDCRLRGICYVYVRLEFGPHGPNAGDQTPMFADGIPNISFVLRGKKDIYDPRTATTGYSTNPALCVANYLCDQRYGVGVDYATGINEAALVAAANSCDEMVPRKDQPDEPRYECNLAFESNVNPQDIIGWILGTMHGQAPYDGERWSIQAGAYRTPTLTFTDDDLRGFMTVAPLISARDLCNVVKGVFTSPDHNWQEFDFPPVPPGSTNAFIAQDGRALYKDISLPGTTSVSTAQRIAKIDLLRNRHQLTVKAPCKLTAWRCQAGDNIMWTSERWGWTSKVFEVRSCTFVTEEGEGGGPILGVDLEMAEVSASDYSWDTTEEQMLAELQPTDLPDATETDPPTNLVATETVYTSLEGGGLRSRIDLSWSPSPDSFALNYEVSYKLRTDSEFIVLPRTSGLTYEIEGLAPGTYDLLVASVNFVGVMSLPHTGSVILRGVGAPPENVDDLTLLPTGGLAQMRWTPPDADVLRSTAGGIEFRHAPVTSGAAWSTSTPIGEVGSPALGFHILPLKAGTYLAVYFQRLANGVRQYSPVPATVYTAQVGLPGFTTLVTSTQDPAFSGTKTQLTVSSSKLKIINGKSIGQYAWPFIDLGAVKRCRVTIGCAAAVTSNSDLVDSWLDVDARPSWDTVVSGREAVVRHRIRWTNDDPAGSPTWSAWQKIDVGEFEARGFSIETEIESIDETWNEEIAALSAVVQELA